MDIQTVMMSTHDALFRNYWLWIIILAVLYAFSLYVYFFPSSSPFGYEGFVDANAKAQIKAGQGPMIR